MYVVHLNVGKVLAACLLVNIAIITPTPTDSSSIPIWEFLTRNEKVKNNQTSVTIRLKMA